jgi:hypothetical protein
VQKLFDGTMARFDARLRIDPARQNQCCQQQNGKPFPRANLQGNSRRILSSREKDEVRFQRPGYDDRNSDIRIRFDCTVNQQFRSNEADRTREPDTCQPRQDIADRQFGGMFIKTVKVSQLQSPAPSFQRSQR